MFLVRFLFRNLKDYRLIVVISIVITLAQVGAEIFSVFPIKFILDKLVNHIDPAFPGAGSLLGFFDQFGVTGHLKAREIHTLLGIILFSVVIFIGFILASAVLAYIQFFLASYIVDKLSTRLRERLFDHLQRLSLDWHGKQKKGDLVQRVTGNIADIEKFATGGLIDWLGGILTIIGLVTVMLSISRPYALLSLAIAPLLFLVTFIYTRNIKVGNKKAARSAGQITDVAVEDIGAIEVLKAFALEDRELHRFRSYVGKYSRANLFVGSLQAQFAPIVSTLVGIGTIAIVSIGAFVAGGGSFSFGFITIPASSISIGTVVLFFIYFGRLYQPIRGLSKLTSLTDSASAGAERIQEVLDQAPEMLEITAPYYGPQRLRGTITFENVFFGYTPERPILEGINLHIPAGKKVALVGLAGAGKTTLVMLIPRFYEPTHGSVKIDGVDNRMYPLSILRQNVSMVLQDSVLFDGTVLDNLKIARPHATMDEVMNATKQAQVHDVIMYLPDGYDTLVRNQGKNFSLGQRQRLAIARALLSDAPILILAEPTASLDVEAEAEVMHALDKLIVGRTVLMISHRLSTLGQVDEIIVLMDGRIVEQGNYQELKRKGGMFAGLLKQQNRYNVDYVDDSNLAFQYPHIALGQGQRQVPPPAPAAPLLPVIPPPPHLVPGGQQQRPAPVANGAIPPIPAGGFVQIGTDRVSKLELFAVARAELEEDDRALIGKAYSVQVGISQSKPENFEGEPFDLFVRTIDEPLPFDILLHASKNIELLTEWQKHLRYYPRNPEPQLVEFMFRIVAPGLSSLDINFYHERRWLRTIHFEFDAAEQLQHVSALNEG